MPLQTVLISPIASATISPLMPTLSEIARLLNVTTDAPDREVTRIATLEEATADDVAYIASEKFVSNLATTKAGVVIVATKLAAPAPATAVVLRVVDPEAAIGLLLAHFAPPASRPAVGVHPSAVIDPTATIGADVSVGPHVVVGEGATVGDRTVLHTAVVIGAHSRVGADCELFAHVVLRERVNVGHRVILHANATIGTDGFGYRWDGSRHAKIPQIGTVVIEDDVEVGSNSCVDRAKFGETRIGRGTKIDNLVQVGHNVRTGAHCILCGQVGIAGSTRLGNGVVMGGHSGANGHITLADGTMVSAFGAVPNDTRPGEQLIGIPALPRREFLREQAALRALPELMKRVKQLEQQLARLTGP